MTAFPDWVPANRLHSAKLSANARHWLLDGSSLTQRLTQRCRDRFHVIRLSHRWERAQRSESQLLQTPYAQLTMIREVVLCCGEVPLVFGRSIFPLNTLKGPLAHLKRLPNRSLGSFLFRQASLRRTPFEVARIPPHTDWIPPHMSRSAHWARRSRFTVNEKDLLVTEVFLFDIDSGR
jgi:chorismate--pyruvate lyase